jgi:hypothetical protein
MRYTRATRRRHTVVFVRNSKFSTRRLTHLKTVFNFHLKTADLYLPGTDARTYSRYTLLMTVSPTFQPREKTAPLARFLFVAFETIGRDHERSEMTMLLKTWLGVFHIFLLFVCFQDHGGVSIEIALCMNMCDTDINYAVCAASPTITEQYVSSNFTSHCWWELWETAGWASSNFDMLTAVSTGVYEKFVAKRGWDALGGQIGSSPL